MTKRIGSIYAIVFELNLVKVDLDGKNEAGEFYDLTFTTCFLTSEKHSFGVHTDKSPKICTHVLQIFLYKAGLLLNIDVAVPFLESKNISKNCVSIQCTPHCQGVSVSPTNQMPAFILIDSPQYHSAPTGARNSSLGHPNMAEASLGKNFPKMIPSLLRVFNGSYLQGLVIWCVSLSRPQNFLCKRRHIARRGGDISSRDARISTFVQLLDALNSFQGCPRLTKDARISPTSSPIDARVSKENSPSDII